jgi:thioredoxin reductase (NADPH)
MSSNHRSLAIIGSGPAGLTAAIYAARANLDPIVFGGYQYGGQLMLTSDVENFPGFPGGILGPELMDNFRAQALRFGTTIIDADVTSVDFTTRPFQITVGEESYTADSVILATGAEAKWLGVDGESRLRGRGVSSCATCDGAFFRNKHITIVGGGDSALEETLFLTRFGSRVFLVHRRDQFRASRIMVDRVMNHPKIEVILNAMVERVLGHESLDGVILRDTVSGATWTHNTDALFVAIGHTPRTDLVRDQLELENGYVASLDGVSTSVEGVFVAGDVFDARYRQAITAAASGSKAALEAERYLEALAH